MENKYSDPQIHGYTMILQATVQDAATIIGIAEKSWAATYREILSSEQYDYMLGKFYSLPAVEEKLGKHEEVFLLFQAGQEIAGFVSYQLNYPEAGYCKIHKLYVLPEVHGTGAGRKLVNAVTEIALRHHCAYLTLNVNKYNKALGFYEKTGFSVAYPEVIDIGRGYVMDDYVLIKNLTPPSERVG